MIFHLYSWSNGPKRRPLWAFKSPFINYAQNRCYSHLWWAIESVFVQIIWKSFDTGKGNPVVSKQQLFCYKLCDWWKGTMTHNNDALPGISQTSKIAHVEIHARFYQKYEMFRIEMNKNNWIFIKYNFLCLQCFKDHRNP